MQQAVEFMLAEARQLLIQSPGSFMVNIIQGSNGMFYSYLSPNLTDKEAEDACLERLQAQCGGEAILVLAMFNNRDFNKVSGDGFFPDMISYSLRKKLLALSPKNKGAKVILWGDGGISTRVTLGICCP